MTDVHPTGVYEARHWISNVNPAIGGEIPVFVPHTPVVPSIDTDLSFLTELELALLRFNTDPVVARIWRLLAAVEAVASSRFEGVDRALSDILDAVAEDFSDGAATSQVVGNLKSMREGLRASDPIVSHDMLHRWHKHMIGPRQHGRDTAGSYRFVQNWIGYWGSTPLNAIYVPPPPELVPELMEDLVTFANDRTIAPVIQAGIAHGHFETIHPYGDGNGRVGRVLIYRILASRGAITSAPPPISPLLEAGRDFYIDGLVAYRDGRADIWVDTFARLLTSAASYGLTLASEITALETGWRMKTDDIRSGAVDHGIVAGLVERPIVDTPAVVSAFGVSNVAARDALLRLVDRGVLVERPRRRGRRGRPTRVFEAAGLFELLDEPPRQLAARLQHQH